MSLHDDLEHVLAHTRDVWEAIRGERVFVTGGTGFFGRWIVESFAHANRALQLGAQIVVLSRDPEAFRRKAPELCADDAVRIVGGDVRTFTAADVRSQRRDENLRFRFVIHAATESGSNLANDDPLVMFDTIVTGTRRALELAAETGAKRLLFTSSGAVYGKQPSDITHVPEEYAGAPDSTDPRSAYAEGKRAAEMLCACFQKQRGVEAVIARCFAFVGPFLPLDGHFAIGNFIRDALRGGPIRVGGDGTPFRSYLYAADLVIWLWTMLIKGGAGRAYNLGSAKEISIAELAKTVRDVLVPDAAVEVAREPIAGAAPSRYVPSNARAIAELGLAEHIDLKTAIQRTAASARGR